MLIADALRALVPLARPFTAFTASGALSGALPTAFPSANDERLAPTHAAWHRRAVVHRQSTGEQLSLLDAPASAAARPLELIRRPRAASPSPRRQPRGARMETAASGLASPVQRHSAAAANDASIKMFWGHASPRADRPSGWAIAGRMADVCAELERLERLERVS